jgi:hypothetical protein
MRQPPLKVLVARRIMSESKDKPVYMKQGHLRIEVCRFARLHQASAACLLPYGMIGMTAR